MCIVPRPERTEMSAKPIPEPEKSAEPTEIGEVRKQEDEKLFGGRPQTRIDRSAVPPNLTSGGTGLKTM